MHDSTSITIKLAKKTNFFIENWTTLTIRNAEAENKSNGKWSEPLQQLNKFYVNRKCKQMILKIINAEISRRPHSNEQKIKLKIYE